MPKLVLACLALAVVLGCGAKPRVYRPGQEWLRAIRIEGNHAIASDDLVPGLVLDRTRLGGRAVDAYQLSVDTERIRAAYVRLGFFDVSVTARIDPRPSGKAIAQTVVFTVVEGRRARLRVVIRGLPPEVPPATARALIELADDAPFEYAAYDAAKAPLVTLVENAGYPQVGIDAAVLADRVSGIATARFDIETGPRATFGVIELEGVDGQLADAVRGRLAFATGDRYSASALAASQRAVFELGRFSTVRFEPDRAAGAVVPVRISVVRAKLRELKLGFGGGADDNTIQVRGRFALSYVFDHLPLWNFGLDVRPAFARYLDAWQPRLRARAYAHRLDFLRPRMRAEIEPAWDYLAYEAYTVTGPKARVGLSSPLGVPWLTGRVSWILELLTFPEARLIEPARSELGLDATQRRGAYELSLDLDLRDNPIEPRSGVFASLRAAVGTPYAGGATTYTQLTPEVRGYVPLGARLVLAARLRLGLLQGDVPITERYYSGGPARHRGFSERQLSPRQPGLVDDVPVDLVVGGEALLETGVEARIPISTVFDFPYGTELFLDGGDVVATASELDTSNLHWAAGLGLYVSFFGVKVRVGAAQRVTRRSEGGFWENIQLYLAVGDAY